MSSEKPAPACRSFYPILVDLGGKKALVVGGGKVAHRKIVSLLDCGASVEVISKNLSSEVAALVKQGFLRHDHQEFSEERLDGVFLVIAATDDTDANRRISEEARKRGLLVNVVDQPADCNFIIPSILRRGDLVVAVSTSGKSPAFARKIREDLEQHFGEEVASFLALMGVMRDRVLALGLSQEKNKDIFEALLSSGLFQSVRDRDWEGAATIVSAVVGRPFASEEIMAFTRTTP